MTASLLKSYNLLNFYTKQISFTFVDHKINNSIFNDKDRKICF